MNVEKMTMNFVLTIRYVVLIDYVVCVVINWYYA